MRRLGLLVVTVLCAVVADVATVEAPAHAMAGGDPVHSRVEAPWMANLVLKGSAPLPERTSCGGALVAPDRVVTAAHCVAGVPLDRLRAIAEVHVGARTLSRQPGRVAGITAVYVDPRFRTIPSPAAPDDPAAASAAFDDAVITLDRPVRGVTPLRVTRRAPSIGDAVTLYGHGITGPGGGVSDALRRGGYRVRSDRSCAAATPAGIDRTSVLCAVSGRTEACTGDSGGPLVRWHRGRPSLVGIFSFGMETAGRPCGSPGPNFFTDATAVASSVSAQTRAAVR